MHARPAPLLPPPTPAEMACLVGRAGLTLNAGQMADLVLGWRHLAELIARLPRDRPLIVDLPFTVSAPRSPFGVPSVGKPLSRKRKVRKPANRKPPPRRR